MKDFVKTMLAVVCGFVVLRILGFLLMLILFGSALISGGAKGSFPRNAVLDMDMSAFTVSEQTEEMPMPSSLSQLQGMVPSLGVRDAVEALKAAAQDPGIQYVFLRADGMSAGLAHTEELRRALVEFRSSGKAVVAYTENPGNGSYYLASAADKIYMGSHHGGNNMLIGIASQSLYLKDILDKVGVHVQLIRHGKYKSAGEMFIRSSASKENREQNHQMVSSIWSTFSGSNTSL